MIKISLPFPPTVWDIYVGWGKTRRKSPEYAKWVQDCGWFIRGRNDRITGSELRTDPWGCADQLYAWALKGW